MKILYCYRYGILGGVCTQFWNRLRYLLQEPGWEVQLLFAMDFGIGDYFGPAVKVRVGTEPAKLPKLISEEKFDVVVIVDTPEYFNAVATGPRSYLLVAEIHASNRQSLEHLRTRTWEPDFFLVPSQYMKQLISREYNVSAGTVKVLPNSIDTTLFQKIDTVSSSQRPILLWVGKIDDHKDWRALLKISQKLVVRSVQFDVWMVGGATCRQKRSEELLSYAEDLEILPRFRWFDRVENEAMPALYSAVAESGGCALITSHDESFGMSLLEALCCGCPSVVTRVGALPEFTTDARLVRFFEVGDYEQAAAHIMALMTPEGTEMARRAAGELASLWRETYNPAVTGPRYAELLSSKGTQRNGSTRVNL